MEISWSESPGRHSPIGVVDKERGKKLRVDIEVGLSSWGFRGFLHRSVAAVKVLTKPAPNKGSIGSQTRGPLPAKLRIFLEQRTSTASLPCSNPILEVSSASPEISLTLVYRSRCPSSWIRRAYIRRQSYQVHLTAVSMI